MRSTKWLRRVVLWLTIATFLVIVWVNVSVMLYYSGGQDAKQTKAQLGCKSLADAIQKYRDHPDNAKHEYPNQLHDLLNPPFGCSPFLKNGVEDLIDPWGQAYQMKPYQQGDGTVIIQVYTHSKDDDTPISQFGVGKTSKVPNR